MLEAIAGSYSAGYPTLELFAGAANSAIGFVAVGGAWEGGLFMGSMANQAVIPGTDGKTFEMFVAPILEQYLIAPLLAPPDPSTITVIPGLGPVNYKP